LAAIYRGGQNEGVELEDHLLEQEVDSALLWVEEVDSVLLWVEEVDSVLLWVEGAAEVPHRDSVAESPEVLH
jgi:hypothetical protein